MLNGFDFVIVIKYKNYKSGITKLLIHMRLKKLKTLNGNECVRIYILLLAYDYF